MKKKKTDNNTVCEAGCAFVVLYCALAKNYNTNIWEVTILIL